jgi:hypothetical protein
MLEARIAGHVSHGPWPQDNRDPLNREKPVEILLITGR